MSRVLPIAERQEGVSIPWYPPVITVSSTVSLGGFYRLCPSDTKGLLGVDHRLLFTLSGTPSRGSFPSVDWVSGLLIVQDYLCILVLLTRYQCTKDFPCNRVSQEFGLIMLFFFSVYSLLPMGSGSQLIRLVGLTSDTGCFVVIQVLP